MGGTIYWRGSMGADRRDWVVNASRNPEIRDSERDDMSSEMASAFSSMHQWVKGTGRAAFAAYAYNGDFAYACFGSEGEMRGQLLFDREAAKSYGIDPSTLDLEAGPRGVAEWSRKYAPMSTDASVIEAIAHAGGAADGVMQLMRVFNIELPGWQARRDLQS